MTEMCIRDRDKRDIIAAAHDLCSVYFRRVDRVHHGIVYFLLTRFVQLLFHLFACALLGLDDEKAVRMEACLLYTSRCV